MCAWEPIRAAGSLGSQGPSGRAFSAIVSMEAAAASFLAKPLPLPWVFMSKLAIVRGFGQHPPLGHSRGEQQPVQAATPALPKALRRPRHPPHLTPSVNTGRFMLWQGSCGDGRLLDLVGVGTRWVMRVCKVVVPSWGHAGFFRYAGVATLVSPLGLSVTSVGFFSNTVAGILPSVRVSSVAGWQRRVVCVVHGMPRRLQPSCSVGVGSGPGQDARGPAMWTPRTP